MQITPYHFDNHEVRVVQGADGEPQFVASDVCAALELPDTHKAVARLDDDEKGRNSIPTLGGSQEMTVINESGLYSLILGSRKPQAKAFKRWVTHEVLPSIRRTGAYIKGPSAPLPQPKVKAKAKAKAIPAPPLNSDWLARSMASAQKLLQLTEGRVGMVDISEQLREFSHPDVAMGMAALLFNRQRLLVEMQSLESAELRALSKNEHIVDVGAEKWADQFVGKMTRAQIVELA
jgi:prophage antirepressor-like protein